MKKINKIDQILERHFPLKQWELSMKDKRRNPEIPVGIIARTVIEMVGRGQRSLLEVDQDMRLPEFKAWHQSKRKMVVSDTTIFRSLEGFAIEPIKKILWETANKMKTREMMNMKLPSGRKIRLGIVDGSQWGGTYGCVLTLGGKRHDVVAGYEMSQGRGHELKTTRKLLQEASEELGKGFVDIIAADGLWEPLKIAFYCERLQRSLTAS